MTSEDDVEKETKDKAARASQAGVEAKATAQDALDAAPDVATGLYAQDVAGALPDSAGDALAAGHQAVRSGGEQVARRVVQRPVEALMLAGAIGYLIGWALNRD